MKNNANQIGMTLIEIMIAMLIGVFLIGGVLQVFVGSKQTNTMLETLSRIQENGRYALGFLSDGVRMTGYMGCPPLNRVVPSMMAAPGIPAVNPTTVLSGGDNIADNWSANACSGGSKCVAGTDAVSIIYGESCGANLSVAMANVSANIQIPANTCDVSTANEALLVSDCNGMDVLVATNSGLSLQHAALSKTYGTDAELFFYRSYTYFIRKNSNDASRSSLWRLDNTQPAGTGQNPIELVEDIEDMQVLYGVDTDGDAAVNYYVPLNNVPVANLPNVISIRVNLLAASSENVTTQPVPYTINGVTTIPTDNRLRRVFSSTIALRNR